MTTREAIELLDEADKLNPGPWIKHSFLVAKAARIITERTKKYNPDKAYVYGLMHDIGRRSGISYIKHTLDGFKFLKDIDWKAAFICISHSFPNKAINEYQGIIDLSKDDLGIIHELLIENEYDFYDYCILLCDSYGFVDGFIKMECRWVDVAIRYGINENTVNKWKRMYEIRNRINDEYQINIEKLLNI
jgi:hypothetical protein